jgi:hypothetical protein
VINESAQSHLGSAVVEDLACAPVHVEQEANAGARQEARHAETGARCQHRAFGVGRLILPEPEPEDGPSNGRQVGLDMNARLGHSGVNLRRYGGECDLPVATAGREL